MNLYLVLALALGAVSGAPAAPVAQPTAHVIAEQGERAAVCGPASAGRVSRDRLKPVPTRRSPRAARLVNTGAATPRAPARS